MADGSFVQQCPQCRTRYQILPASYGRRIRCTKCGAEFRAAIPQPVPPPPPVAAQPAAKFSADTEPENDQFDFGSMPKTSYSGNSSYRRPQRTKGQNLNLVIVLSAVAMFGFLLLGVVASNDESSRPGTNDPGIGSLIVGVPMMLALFLAYFAPIAIAYSRDHANTLPIAILNIFLGWSLVGWVVALAWALSSDVKQSRVYVKKVIVRKNDVDDDDDWN